MKIPACQLLNRISINLNQPYRERELPEQHESPLLEAVKTAADNGFAQWRQDNNDRQHGLPIKGRLYGALIVLSNLERKEWRFSELGEATSTDPGKFFSDRSIRGHTINRVSSVLKNHGHEDLAPPGGRGELGRTSTGTKRAGLRLIQLIWSALLQAPEDRREEQGDALVAYLYEQVFSLLWQYHELGGIEEPFNASESITAYISKLLDAHQSNPGAVLQHLVGAKLEIRFAGQPVVIDHHSSATADVQTGRLGDFVLGSTVFHVTKRATDDHYRKAKQNADNGRKVYLLVPDIVLQAVKQYAEAFASGFCRKVDIFSIEQFVAQNLDELAVFDRTEALRQLRLLLEKYNDLVETYENDRSLKIIIPDFGVE